MSPTPAAVRRKAAAPLPPSGASAAGGDAAEPADRHAVWEPPPWLAALLFAACAAAVVCSDVPALVAANGRTTPAASWLALGGCFFSFIVFVRVVTFPALLVPLARVLGARDETKAYRTAQQLLNLAHHCTCTAAAAVLLGQERWWYWNEPQTMWEGWAEGAHKHTASVHVLYMLQLGYHAHCLLFHFVEPRRSDFTQMLVHHAVTAYLVHQSYVLNFVHIGLLVLFAHDTSDVVGCTIKITNYVEWKYVTVGIFPVLLFTWAYTRLWLYPSNCIVASWHYAAGFEQSAGYTACFVLMFVILSLNAFWYAIFLQILVRLFKSSVKDPDTTDLSEDRPSGEQNRTH
eukprot:TRINITY_DN9_c0_g1_i1.p1 TRINITY_DN9_c0_g1~~TRINITY_DN9_c0_g1_i1.p1  ORF type:complete len:345 (+),score=106.73 TRINITY_DN9_c0_g1_i1:50-1084(+)